MRFLNICFLMILSVLSLQARDEIGIISRGSHQGLADDSGKILIPAIYEKLGWSDGTFSLHDDLIGYYSRGKWGLISTKNKKITDPIYNSLVPVGSKAFIASHKANLTNHIFYGMVNKKGIAIVQFEHFEIEDLTSNRIRVGDYRDGKVWSGVRTYDDEELIPSIYESIYELENLLVCQGKDGLFKIFSREGTAVFPGWLDQIKDHPKGFEIVIEGRRGLLSRDYQLLTAPGSKGLSEDGSNHSFDQWEVRSIVQDTIFFQSCDSITFLNEKLWIAHVNNAQHMLGAHEKLFSNQKYLLKHIQRGFIVAQNKHSGKWGLYRTNGDIIEEDFDYIKIDSNYFFCRRNQRWDIYNSFSRKLNKTGFHDVETSIARNIPVKRNGFWGWVDFRGETLVSFKFDDIKPGIKKQYIAKYLDKWGIANFPESWVALPEFDTIMVDDEFYLAKRGHATYIIDSQGELVLRTGYDVFSHDDVIYLRDDDKYGLVTELGVIVHPKFEYVRKIGGFYACRKDSLFEMYNSYGRKILSEKDQIQEIFSFSEGYFHVLKDNKHGFVDENGKLRIANRYDGALPYKEGFAAVKLRGRWGYINKSEQLVVQPHYDLCSEFKKGLASVSKDGKHGIIDSKGQVVVSHDFSHIQRTKFGNYIMTDLDSKQGLADNSGKVLLRSDYDELLDTAHDFVIARRGSNYGVITYEGYSYLPFDYRHVEVQGDYLLLLGD